MIYKALNKVFGWDYVYWEDTVNSGIGGFELGIQQAVPNAKCVGFSEVDKWAVSIYNRQFKGHKNYGDANKINPSEIPDFDVLVGGFPCQAFSIAGHRKGFDDTRGTLFFEIARILEAKRPRHFILENVKGLLSHDGGQHSKPSSARLMSWGMMSSGKCLTAKISACHKTESGCSLLDILEPASSVPDKYFLSDKATKRLLGYQATKQTPLQQGTGKHLAPVHISVGRMK